MASTNKTSNYELSQFLGTDKPAWLSDYNQDMSKIDSQMKANADAATAAGGSATSANTAIGTLANLTTTAKTDLVNAINEVDSNADTAQNTANNAVNASETNASNINALAAYLNLNNFTTPSVTVSGGTVVSNLTGVNCASNADGSLGKIYGRIGVSASGANMTLTFATPLRPTSAITVNGIGLGSWSDAPSNPSTFSNPTPLSVSIGTDGTATISITGATSGRQYRLSLIACVIFAKSFGDTPVEE